MWFAFALSLVASASTQGKASAVANASCPADTEVDAELARLGVATGPRPTISFEGQRMMVLLRTHDGAILGSREVDAPVACRERAVVVAVLVASWMGVWPEGPKADGDAALPSGNAPPPASAAPAPVGPSLPSFSVEHRPTVAVPTVPIASAVTPPPSATTPPLPTVAPLPSTTAPAPSLTGSLPTPQVRAKRPADLGLAILGAYDGNASALATALDARLSLVGRLRGFVGLSCTTERDRSVGAGVGGYTIPALEIGPAVAHEHGRLRGEIGVSPRLGLLVLRGKNMPSTHTTERFIPGMAAHLRLVRVGARFSPFVTAVGSWWIGRRTLALDDSASTADLPGWDAQIGLGLLWSLGK